MNRYTGYGNKSTNSRTNTPSFSRGRYKTSSSQYGAHYSQQVTSSNLKKYSWEKTPVGQPLSKAHPMSNASKNPVKGKDTVKSSTQGYNPSTSKTLHNSKDTSHLPAGGTIGTRGYAQSKTTTSVTGSTAGSHSVTTSKTTSHSSTVAAGHGGYSFPTSKDNRTIHQHVDVTKSSIAQDYSVSRTNAGMHQSPVLRPAVPSASDFATTTTTTANATITVSKPNNVTGGNSLTVGGGCAGSNSTSKEHKEPSVSAIHKTLLNDTSNKQLMGQGSYSNSSIQGRHQSPVLKSTAPFACDTTTTTTTTNTIVSKPNNVAGGNSITGGGGYAGSNSTSKDDRTSYHSTVPHKPDVNHYPYHSGVNKKSNDGSDSFGSGFSGYTRHPTVGIGRPSHSTKQLVRGLTNLGNTCFYNAVMQNLTVLVILHNELNTLVNSFGSRSYTIPGERNLDAGPLTVTINTKPSSSSLTSKLYQFLNNYSKGGNPNPSTVLESIGTKNMRFRGRSQQDSHELFRALLDGIRTEEADLIKKAIDEELGNSMDGEAKLKKKVYRRNIVTKIDDVFGGKTCSIVICRECHHVSQTVEPFLDLSLPIVDNQRASSKHGVMRKRMADKQTTTFNGVCELIEQQQQEEDMAYPMVRERSHDGMCSIENCLSDYTDLEVMDDDNMFICSECNKKVQATGKGNNEPILSPVSKLLLISKLPPVLVLHLKRFNLGYTVTKNNKHVKFSVKLNMKKYCTNQCKGGYEYRLKGVVSHSGSLNFGHYIAYVCTDNQWYYASDSHVSTASTERVLSCEAYMLFYERTC